MGLTAEDEHPGDGLPLVLRDRGERGERERRADRDEPHERRGGRHTRRAQVHRRGAFLLPSLARAFCEGDGRRAVLIWVGRQFVSDDPEKSVVTFLLTAAAVGMLFKRGSTISAADQ